MTSYSDTPLAKKLGIKDGCRLYIRNSPPGFETLLNPAPENIFFLKRLSREIDIVLFFVKNRSSLEKDLELLLPNIKRDGMIWVCWPKKSSKVETDITEDTIRSVALPIGLVDIKVCAVDIIWSGLKLVMRKENR